MNDKDIQFVILNNNQEIHFTIITMIPKNETESYIVFTENNKEEENEIILKYGILVNNNDSLELKKGISQEELKYIKEQFHEELIEFSKKTIESDLA